MLLALLITNFTHGDIVSKSPQIFLWYFCAAIYYSSFADVCANPDIPATMVISIISDEMIYRSLTAL